MGLDITYIAEENKMSFRLPPSDIDVLSFLRRRGFEYEIDIIFGSSDFGEQTHIDSTILLKSVTRLIESIKDDPNMLPYVYSSKVEIPRGSSMYSTGSGTLSGFKIDGEPYLFETGFDKCELRKLRQDNSGKWLQCDTRDVRNMKVVKIDNDNFFGDITITKKRRPNKLLCNLEQLRSFISAANVEIIVKILG